MADEKKPHITSFESGITIECDGAGVPKKARLGPYDYNLDDHIALRKLFNAIRHEAIVEHPQKLGHNIVEIGDESYDAADPGQLSLLLRAVVEAANKTDETPGDVTPTIPNAHDTDSKKQPRIHNDTAAMGRAAIDKSIERRDKELTGDPAISKSDESPLRTNPEPLAPFVCRSCKNEDCFEAPDNDKFCKNYQYGGKDTPIDDSCCSTCAEGEHCDHIPDGQGDHAAGLDCSGYIPFVKQPSAIPPTPFASTIVNGPVPMVDIDKSAINKGTASSPSDEPHGAESDALVQVNEVYFRRADDGIWWICCRVIGETAFGLCKKLNAWLVLRSRPIGGPIQAGPIYENWTDAAISAVRMYKGLHGYPIDQDSSKTPPAQAPIDNSLKPAVATAVPFGAVEKQGVVVLCPLFRDTEGKPMPCTIFHRGRVKVDGKSSTNFTDSDPYCACGFESYVPGYPVRCSLVAIGEAAMHAQRSALMADMSVVVASITGARSLLDNFSNNPPTIEELRQAIETIMKKKKEDVAKEPLKTTPKPSETCADCADFYTTHCHFSKEPMRPACAGGFRPKSAPPPTTFSPDHDH